MRKISIVFLRGINWYGNEEILFAKFRKFFEEKNFQVIIPKFKGLTIEKNIQSLRREIKKYGLSEFILIGFSFGGLLAQIYFVRYPDEIQALALINPVGKDGLIDAGIILNLAKNLVKGIKFFSLPRTIKDIFYGNNFSDAEAMYYVNLNMRREARENVWLMGEIFFKGLLTGRQGAKNIIIDKNVPILTVVGQKDNILIPEYAARSVKKIDTEYFIIPEAGHSLPLEPVLWRIAAEKIYQWVDLRI